MLAIGYAANIYMHLLKCLAALQRVGRDGGAFSILVVNGKPLSCLCSALPLDRYPTIICRPSLVTIGALLAPHFCKNNQPESNYFFLFFLLLDIEICLPLWLPPTMFQILPTGSRRRFLASQLSRPLCDAKCAKISTRHR